MGTVVLRRASLEVVTGYIHTHIYTEDGGAVKAGRASFGSAHYTHTYYAFTFYDERERNMTETTATLE